MRKWTALGYQAALAVAAVIAAGESRVHSGGRPLPPVKQPVMFDTLGRVRFQA